MDKNIKVELSSLRAEIGDKLRDLEVLVTNIDKRIEESDEIALVERLPLLGNLINACEAIKLDSSVSEYHKGNFERSVNGLKEIIMKSNSQRYAEWYEDTVRVMKKLIKNEKPWKTMEDHWEELTKNKIVNSLMNTPVLTESSDVSMNDIYEDEFKRKQVNEILEDLTLDQYSSTTIKEILSNIKNETNFINKVIDKVDGYGVQIDVSNKKSDNLTNVDVDKIINETENKLEELTEHFDNLMESVDIDGNEPLEDLPKSNNGIYPRKIPKSSSTDTPEKVVVELDDKDIKDALKRMDAVLNRDPPYQSRYKPDEYDLPNDVDLNDAPDWARFSDQKSSSQLMKEASQWDVYTFDFFTKMWNNSIEKRFELLRKHLETVCLEIKRLSPPFQLTCNNIDDVKNAEKRFGVFEVYKDIIIKIINTYDRNTLDDIMINKYEDSFVGYYKWINGLIDSLERLMTDVKNNLKLENEQDNGETYITFKSIDLLKFFIDRHELELFEYDANQEAFLMFDNPPSKELSVDELEKYRNACYKRYKVDLKNAYEWLAKNQKSKISEKLNEVQIKIDSHEWIAGNS